MTTRGSGAVRRDRRHARRCGRQRRDARRHVCRAARRPRGTVCGARSASTAKLVADLPGRSMCMVGAPNVAFGQRRRTAARDARRDIARTLIRDATSDSSRAPGGRRRRQSLGGGARARRSTADKSRRREARGLAKLGAGTVSRDRAGVQRARRAARVRARWARVSRIGPAP
jgi:hypothetical protein